MVVLLMHYLTYSSKKALQFGNLTIHFVEYIYKF